MEFDFLPKLPSSNLDDRNFDDLVEDCLLRIPRYCPEWTDHNLSDPGITLIELFAWLTDQMLLRFNQVPRKTLLDQKLRLLAFLALPPVPGLDGVPVDLLQLIEITAILEEAGAGIRQREGPAAFILIGPIDDRSKIGLQVNDWALPAAIGQLWVIALIDQIEHD